MLASHSTYLMSVMQVCKWLGLNPEEINALGIPFCGSCDVLPKWSGWLGWGWVPNADWNSISASSVSKIPHLPLREAAWKMWGIFSYITFNTPLLWNLHPGIMFEASWSKGVPRYEIQVYCILIVKTSVLELCKYQLV